jgi:hypothetical protein
MMLQANILCGFSITLLNFVEIKSNSQVRYQFHRSRRRDAICTEKPWFAHCIVCSLPIRILQSPLFTSICPSPLSFWILFWSHSPRRCSHQGLETLQSTLGLSPPALSPSSSSQPMDTPRPPNPPPHAGSRAYGASASRSASSPHSPCSTFASKCSTARRSAIMP